MATDQIIQRAFNAGYLVEKHLPQLSKLLVKGFQDSKNPYAQGFIAGSNEFSKEKTVSKSRFLERLQEKYGDTKRDKGKKRDDREMDIDI